MKTFLLLVPAALGIAMVSCKREAAPATAAPPPGQAPQPVETMPVEARRLQETISLVGTIAANESAELRPEIPGTITEIPFQEGTTVKKGEILVRLDTRELEAQLEETRASFELATRTLERTRTLAAENAVSRLELDTATAAHARLRSAIDLLEVRIDKSTLTAPFDGITGARIHSVGDFLTPQSVVTTIDDLSRLKVEMEVPERYLPLLQPGAGFRIATATSASNAEVSGEVYFVSPRIDATTRSTQVKGYVLDPPPFLKPGMFANITLILRTVEDALVVPETAILSTARGTVVITPETNDKGQMVAAFVPVKTGIRQPGIVQISPIGPPITVGQPVVSSGVGGLILFPGAPIRTVEPVVTPESPPVTDRKLD
jgi:membrane fusion protein (multidrug efflux system)